MEVEEVVGVEVEVEHLVPSLVEVEAVEVVALVHS